MNIQNKRCDRNCNTINCFCGIQLNLLHHIKLTCCNSICHVMCISNYLFCPVCSYQFTKEDLNYINQAVVKILEKEEIHKIKKQRQIALRKEIKKIVNQIIKKRLNVKKNE